jgi:hypothetical protein
LDQRVRHACPNLVVGVAALAVLAALWLNKTIRAVMDNPYD